MSLIEIFLFNNCFINFNTNIRISNGKFNEYIINKNINVIGNFFIFIILPPE